MSSTQSMHDESTGIETPSDDWEPNTFRPFVLAALSDTDDSLTIRQLEDAVSSLVSFGGHAARLHGTARLDHDLEALRIEGLVTVANRSVSLTKLGSALLRAAD